MSYIKLVVGVFLFFIMILPVYAEDYKISDDRVRELIIEESIRQYPGNCPCPYNRASNGSRCGKRSAWSRAGGYSPLCYSADVTDDMVQQYRQDRGQ